MGFLFGQPVIQTEPKARPPMTQRQQNLKWMALAPHVKKHFKLDKDVKEIAADLSLAAYKNYLKDKNKK